MVISHSSIIVPFLLGALLALYLYPRLSSPDVPFASFALFMGVAMSITAFPVLARILTERRLLKTKVGALAHHLRGGRRRDRVVPAGLRGLHRQVGERRRARCHRLALALAYIAAMMLRGAPVLARGSARSARATSG